MADEAPWFLGIEIGGTKLQVGVGRGDGTIVALDRRVIRPDRGASAILDQVAAMVPPLLDHPALRGRSPEAAGIGFGGPVDAVRGVTLRSHQVEGWDDFDLAGWAVRTLGLPRVVVRNDADTAGLGEALHGAGVGLSPVFYVTIGSGIGGGLILDGRIYEGSGRGAAEVGHAWVDRPNQAPRTLEAIASGWAIGSTARALKVAPEDDGPLARALRDDLSAVDAVAVARAAEAGDPTALAVLGEATDAMGRVLAQVVTLLAPRRIILGGGVSLVGDPLWLDPIRRAVAERAFPPFAGTYDVVTAELGELVVVHGALALAAGSAPPVISPALLKVPSPGDRPPGSDIGPG